MAFGSEPVCSLPKAFCLAQGKGFSCFKSDFANQSKLYEASKHSKDQTQIVFAQSVAENKMYLWTLSEPPLMCIL